MEHISDPLENGLSSTCAQERQAGRSEQKVRLTSRPNLPSVAVIHATTKATCGREGLFPLVLPGYRTSWWGIMGRNSSTDSKQRPWGASFTQPPLVYSQSPAQGCFHPQEAEPSRSKAIKKRPTQTHPRANPICAILQLRFPLPGRLALVLYQVDSRL